jgi:hypothetical protein
MAAIVAEQRANISAAENEQADAVRRERTRKQNRVRQARKRDRDVKAKFGIDPSGNPTEKPRRSSSDGRVLGVATGVFAGPGDFHYVSFQHGKGEKDDARDPSLGREIPQLDRLPALGSEHRSSRPEAGRDLWGAKTRSRLRIPSFRSADRIYAPHTLRPSCCLLRL